MSELLSGNKYKSKKILSIFDGMKFKKAPWEHQLQALAFLLDREKSGWLWLPIGCGKSAIPLMAAEKLKLGRVLVICPNGVVRGWIEQTNRFTEYTGHSIKGWEVEQFERNCMFSSKQVFVVNYEGLRKLFGKKVQVEDKNGDIVNKIVVDLSSINSVAHQIDLLIIDESHHCKDHTALQTKICHQLSKHAKYTVCMTGTPIGNNLLDTWSQMYLIDGGKSLGTSFYQFREAYFYKAGFTWKPKDGAIKVIFDLMDKHVLAYTKQEVHNNLPEIVYEEYKFELTGKALSIYKETEDYLINQIIIAKETPINDIPQTQMVLAEITGGHIKGRTETVRVSPANKLFALEELLPELLSDDGKIIIFHNFVYDSILISELLSSMKLKHAIIRGGIGDKKKFENEHLFRNDKDCRILVANPASCGEGVNFEKDGNIVANKIVFYSNVYSGLLRQQAEGRIYRAGQNKGMLVIDLIAVDTIDEHIVSCVKNNVANAESTYNYFAGKARKRI